MNPEQLRAAIEDLIVAYLAMQAAIDDAALKIQAAKDAAAAEAAAVDARSEKRDAVIALLG